MARTAVETLNLSTCGGHHDVLKAECIRTFPTVHFPAAELLRREETETQTGQFKKGRSIVVAVQHNRAEGTRTWTTAPFDKMYGFRGSKRQVDLLSAFEMLRYWGMQKVYPPKKNDPCPTSKRTKEGEAYCKQCLAAVKEKRFGCSGCYYSCRCLV